MNRRPGLLASIGLNLASLVMTLPALALVGLTVAGIASSVAIVGLFILAVTLVLLRQLAGVQRRLVTAGLGEPVARAYADTRGLAPVARVRRWFTDRARWADAAWALFTCTVGAIVSVVALAVVLYPVWSITWYFLWRSLPADLPQPYHFLHVADPVRGAVFTVVSVLAGIAGMRWLTPALTRWRLLMDASIIADSRTAALEERVERVTASRTSTVDAAAAELRRIERDLHDGPQARLAALGMELGLAEQLALRDPQAAAGLIAEARANAHTALADIRSVVRGIYPPVLADRGYPSAISALVADLPLAVSLDLEPGERLSPPLESALYFATSECLANILKHAHAGQAWVCLRRTPRAIRVEVGDDGVGGAAADGAGLRGVARRLAAFDGMMSVTSPPGAGTRIEMEVPCEPSSGRTTRSFATD
ncbi:sensor domain-containing protein [Allobranchiibius sp. GilTou38]|uniref:sensor histidine kinase n=1 Tax=Allobranchiibius sp. GilTou38 TaxID=2815210 RepID=UPI001AA17455|nr:sensor domain-containing protein [Allobranchiibius sp. GilTou38]MBO1767937.1 sensor domain-containing protein [Allobranchiibius sp. GilTou38]